MCSRQGWHNGPICKKNTTSRSAVRSTIKQGMCCTQSCPVLCIPMDCNPPGSSVHAISQARILEWGLWTQQRWGGEREGEMYGESNMETYITICTTECQQEFAVWLRELKQGFCNSLEGWDGEGDKVQEGGDICTPMTDSCWYLAENSKIL